MPIPIIYNVTCTNADTDYTQVLPVGTRKILTRVRGHSTLKVAYGAVGVTGAFVSVKANEAYSDDDIYLESGSCTLYFQSPTAGAVVEIVAWT